MSPVSPGHNKRRVHLCGQTGLTGVRWRRRKRKRPAGLRSVTVYQPAASQTQTCDCVSTEAGMGGVATQKSCLWWPCSHLQVFSCATAVRCDDSWATSCVNKAGQKCQGWALFPDFFDLLNTTSGWPHVDVLTYTYTAALCVCLTAHNCFLCHDLRLP